MKTHKDLKHYFEKRHKKVSNVYHDAASNFDFTAEI